MQRHIFISLLCIFLIGGEIKSVALRNDSVQTDCFEAINPKNVRGIITYMQSMMVPKVSIGRKNTRGIVQYVQSLIPGWSTYVDLKRKYTHQVSVNEVLQSHIYRIYEKNTMRQNMQKECLSLVEVLMAVVSLQKKVDLCVVQSITDMLQ